jgi:hypothetical protein
MARFTWRVLADEGRHPGLPIVPDERAILVPHLEAELGRSAGEREFRILEAGRPHEPFGMVR